MAAMDRDFEKRWERIREQLQVQMHGDEQPRLCSRRTLFGIQSEVERKMDGFAAQIEAENAAKRKAKSNEDADARNAQA